jgi:hypothetical protein
VITDNITPSKREGERERERESNQIICCVNLSAVEYLHASLRKMSCQALQIHMKRYQWSCMQCFILGEKLPNFSKNKWAGHL